MTLDPDLRKEWSLVRYQYYTSGRSDVIFSNLGVQGVILGYAIETSYKHLLHELGFVHGGILHSHSVRTIHDYLISSGGPAPLVSNDFLDFIDNHLNARYPSQREKTEAIVKQQNRLLMFNCLAMSFYDDLMFQLDNLILSMNQNDLNGSVYFRGASDCLTLRGMLFFHANYHAYLSNANLINFLQGTPHNQELHQVTNFRDQLYNNVQFPIQSQDINQVNYQKDFCSSFVYPTWTIDPVTGNEIINVKVPHRIGINIQI